MDRRTAARLAQLVVAAFVLGTLAGAMWAALDNRAAADQWAHRVRLTDIGDDRV